MEKKNFWDWLRYRTKGHNEELAEIEKWLDDKVREAMDWDAVAREVNRDMVGREPVDAVEIATAPKERDHPPLPPVRRIREDVKFPRLKKTQETG